MGNTRIHETCHKTKNPVFKQARRLVQSIAPKWQ